VSVDIEAPTVGLAGGRSGPDALRPLLDVVLGALAEGVTLRGGPVCAGEPAQLAAHVRETVGEVLPAVGTGAAAALAPLTRLLAYGAADPADPACVAHLHCPPLAIAVAAEVAAAALNPSLDSWDQAPAATMLETEVVRALAGLVGYDSERAGGVVTSGGTESNLMGLLLARDAAVDGMAGAAGRLRVFCSELAHFSVARNAAVLGLGEAAVVPVPVDSHHRMDPAALQRALAATVGVPAAVVATAGTTDFGSLDPLVETAALARDHGAWVHVDAAYGGGALFSDRLAGLLDGLAGADSVSLDLHKIGWQPVAAGVFLVRQAEAMSSLARRVAYLNPADDEAVGYPSLLGNSLRTTRRPDVFKIAVTLRALGRDGLGRLVDACHDLARYAAERVAEHRRLELTAEPVLTTVVFRYLAATDADRVNASLRRRLLRTGQAVIGRTEAGDGSVRLKLTLLNPQATRADIDGLIAAVVAAGEAEDR